MFEVNLICLRYCLYSSVNFTSLAVEILKYFAKFYRNNSNSTNLWIAIQTTFN